MTRRSSTTIVSQKKCIIFTARLSRSMFQDPCFKIHVSGSMLITRGCTQLLPLHTATATACSYCHRMQLLPPHAATATANSYCHRTHQVEAVRN